MNIYYAPPSQIHNGFIELRDQEAAHASKAMRASEGDQLFIVDGNGGRYQGPIRRITKQSIQIKVEEREHIPESQPSLILGMGIIKKRDRLEFAIEKAVELGVNRIFLFRSERTIKQNVRMDRLESIAVSAMKQSLRAWLPDITLFHSFDEVFTAVPDANFLIAHEKVEDQAYAFEESHQQQEQYVLLVGPEGGFTSDEVDYAKEQRAEVVSLGTNRLRTETAVVAFLGQFL